MIVRIARAKVGHRQAPNKYKAPPGSPVRGFVLVGSLKGDLRRDENKPSIAANPVLCLQGLTMTCSTPRACFSAG